MRCYICGDDLACCPGHYQSVRDKHPLTPLHRRSEYMDKKIQKLEKELKELKDRLIGVENATNRKVADD